MCRRRKKVEDEIEIIKKCGAAKRVWLVLQLRAPKREALWRRKASIVRWLSRDIRVLPKPEWRLTLSLTFQLFLILSFSYILYRSCCLHCPELAGFSLLAGAYRLNYFTYRTSTPVSHFVPKS